MSKQNLLQNFYLQFQIHENFIIFNVKSKVYYKTSIFHLIS